MKILNVKQIREADAYTIEQEGVPSIELMERAASGAAHFLLDHFPRINHWVVFSGKGNNGGDGLAMARNLVSAGKRVSVYIIEHTDSTSPDFKENLKRVEVLSIDLHHIKYSDPFPEISPKAGLIDAVLGSGIDHVLRGLVEEFVQYWNALPNLRIAIDIPTGLFGDDNSENDLNKVAVADHTLTFQMPKLAFMQPSSGALAGFIHIIDIGLSRKFLDTADTPFYYTLAKDLIPNLRHRNRYDYKNKMGHGLLVAGAYGKMGACVLSSKAFMRTGAGLLTVHVPQCGYNILQHAVPEAMVESDRNDKMITELPLKIPFQAIGFGPGIGTNYATRTTLAHLFKTYNRPVVLDADALNLIAEHPELLVDIPHNSILTPHPGEFERMSQGQDPYANQWKVLREYAVKYHIIVVFKGPNSAIAAPDGKIYFNSTGTPALATAGSGDVLTGIITSLLARGYEPLMAARMGVYLHGRAGELAEVKLGMESVIAQDIIDFIPEAMKELYG